MLYAVMKHAHIHDSQSKSFNAKVSFQDKSLNLPMGGGPLSTMAVTSLWCNRRILTFSGLACSGSQQWSC